MKYTRVVYARVLYFINNDNDVFYNDFQMPQSPFPTPNPFIFEPLQTLS